MNKIYDDNESLFSVGRIYAKGNWREYITTVKDNLGFYHFYMLVLIIINNVKQGKTTDMKTLLDGLSMNHPLFITKILMILN